MQMFKKKTWWEEEAEKQCLTPDQYIRLLKLEKENAELQLQRLKWEIERNKKDVNKEAEIAEGKE